jgi:hypothetical protein
LGDDATISLASLMITKDENNMISKDKSKDKQNDLLQHDLENVKRKTAKADHSEEDDDYDEKKKENEGYAGNSGPSGYEGKSVDTPETGA